MPIWDTFRGRFANVVAAKDEVFHLRSFREKQSRGLRTLDSRKNFRVMREDATQLDQLLGAESVDYIFTDPPYGAFISYLDLSILWNHWLGLDVTEDSRNRETIVGDEQDHSESHYKDSLARSLTTSMCILRPDRWFSIVFQHWDTSYFSTILDTVDQCGGELRAAVTQTGDVIWSMHKKKNSVSVLGGEMILKFYESKRAKKADPQIADAREMDAASTLSDVFDECLKNDIEAFTNEALFNRIVIELWRRRALKCLELDRKEFNKRLEERGWTHSSRTHLWSRVGGGRRGAVAASLFER